MTLLELPSNNKSEIDTIKISHYQQKDKAQWDSFVANSKNGVFLFLRDYMEYHADRYQDNSLQFYRNGQLVGLLPANRDHNTLHSHAGLTFGGLICGVDMTQTLMLSIFDAITAYCKTEGITQFIYKTIPYIYHSAPANEDLYALFRNNAQLIARNVSSTIDLREKQPFDSRRKESLRKARKNGLVVKRSYDLKSFMALAEYVLMEKHGVRPVHTIDELAPLMQRFPENIKLFVSCKQDQMLAGIIMYESANVAHGQYAANSEVGRAMGAQDIIEDYLINRYYARKKYFDFGISTLKLGRELNESLLSRKEGFGASTVTYDFYEILFSS